MPNLAKEKFKAFIIKTTKLCALLALLSISILAQSSAEAGNTSFKDISGQWSGSFDLIFPDGKTQRETAWFDLKQSGASVTGTAGPSRERQSPITSGSISGRELQFTVEVRAGTTLIFKLVIENNHLRGAVTGDSSPAQIKIDVVPVRDSAFEKVPATRDLFSEILQLDQAMFEAFNRRDLDKFKAFFAEDLEFYQDLTGLTSYSQNIETFKTNFAKETKIRRELDIKSLQIYPVKDYGAIEIGTHRFYTIEKGQPEKLTAEVKFVHIWRKRDGGWVISRIISYGH